MNEWSYTSNPLSVCLFGVGKFLTFILLTHCISQGE